MAAPGPIEPRTLILPDVPYLGNDWQKYLDGPQDFTFPSAMRAVMHYLGEPQEREYRYYLAIGGQGFQQVWDAAEWRCAFDIPWLIDADPRHAVDRMFLAAGYGYEVLGRPELCEKLTIPPTALTRQVDAAELRRTVCAGIAAGKPAIVFGDMPGAAVIAGYQGGGDTLAGRHLVFEEDKVQRLPSGYVLMPDWLQSAAVAVIVGDKAQAPPIRDTYREALLRAVKCARTPRVGDWAGGLEAIQAWAEAVERDGDFAGLDEPTLRQRFNAHDMQALAVAEGRAFANDVLRRVAEVEPEAAEDLHAAADCYGLMHDLMWRIWRVPGGWGPGDAPKERLLDPEVRRELSRTIRIVRDLDVRAISHIEQALLKMGVSAADIAPPLPWEREAEERLAARDASSGSRREPMRHENIDTWVDGVPQLAFGGLKECTFIGALEAALAPTQFPYSYEQLMGQSGLAFRTRWFSNPQGAQTPLGTGRWHPVSPHGEGQQEIAALSRATGWRLRVEQMPAEPRALGRERLATDIVVSLSQRLPVIVGLSTDLACVYGYHIHSTNLLVRDYQRPDQGDVRVSCYDQALQSPCVFLDGHVEPLPTRDAFLAALTIAVEGARRPPAEGFHFGPDALETWVRDLTAYEACSEADGKLLRLCNWWTLMHLPDARSAAAEFLDEGAQPVGVQATPALEQAAEAYGEEVELLAEFLEANSDFLPWRGGRQATDWDAATRQRQVELLVRATALEREALGALEQVVATEGR